MSEFTDLLEEFREQRSLSKKDLALRAGLSSGYISLLTRGDRETPSEETVNALAVALQLDTSQTAQLFKAAGYELSSASLSKRKQKIAPREDWGEAPNVTVFYGRKNDLERLERWIVTDRCQMVAVLGMGGVGKSMLAARVAENVRTTFEYVFWRSFEMLPSIEDVLTAFFQLFPHQHPIPRKAEDQISLLIKYMQEYRCLIILDNFECLLKAGSYTGQYEDQYEAYGALLRRVGKVRHQSCLLLTSREKPVELPPLEGKDRLVRSMYLTGMVSEEAQEFLKSEELQGNAEAWGSFVNFCAGNPSVLKLVSDAIRELFAGNISVFLKKSGVIAGETVVGNLYAILDEQFHRLSPLEQQIVYWLAIEREPVSFDDLLDDLEPRVSTRQLLEVLQSLRRRSMVETSDLGFSLRRPVIEYVTNRLVEEVYDEIQAEDVEKIKLLAQCTLIKAQAKDYIRTLQKRNVLQPIVNRLLGTLEKEEIKRKLDNLLCKLRETKYQTSGYAAGNILNLLTTLKTDLKGYDLSGFAVRQAYLQDVPLHEVNFTDADLSGSAFTDTFSSIFAVALSPKDDHLAAGTASGEIRLWNTSTTLPLTPLRGRHTGWVRAVAFSPTENMLASGSEDQTVRLWDIRTGECLYVLREHRSRIYSVAFSPNGDFVASGGDDQFIHFWNAHTGEHLQPLQEYSGRVYSIAFSPTGNIIASGNKDQTIRLWDINTGQCLKTLQGHTSRVRSVAFSPDGSIIVSSSEDRTLRLWDTSTGECLKILQGHTHPIWSTAFSPKGDMIASGSGDQTIRLWDVRTGNCLREMSIAGYRVHSVSFGRDGSTVASGNDSQTICLWNAHTGACLKTLQGHGTRVYSISFSPDGHTVASGSEDQNIYLWDVNTGDLLRTLREHSHWVWSVAFSSQGILASGSEDGTVKLWHVDTGICFKTLKRHSYRVTSVAFSPDGSTVASGSGDQTINLWHVSTGELLKTLEGHGNRVCSVAFSPKGDMIASGSDDRTVRLWNAHTGECLHVLSKHTDRVCSVAFSPAGDLIASGSDDHTVCLWDAHTGKYLKALGEHSGRVYAVAFSPDGETVASGSDDRTIHLWNVSTGEYLKALEGHESTIYSVVFSPKGTLLASGSHDGIIKLWDIYTGVCLRTLRSDRPYERMNIKNVKGLTDSQKDMLRALGAIWE